jgi:hypothetical protein
MRVFAIRIELANNVTVQRLHDADAREQTLVPEQGKQRYERKCMIDESHWMLRLIHAAHLGPYFSTEKAGDSER